MCYSAKVWQKIKEYYRRMNAMPDYGQIELVFARRLSGSTIRIPRGFEENFDQPANAAEKRIKELIDDFRAKERTRLEQDLFTNKKRLAEAERALKVKETKKALNDQRVAGNNIERITGKLDVMKGVAVDPDAERIFPFHYGPIVISDGGEKRLILARYHCRQLGQAAFIDKKFPGLYNARRDSLEKYWKETFGKRHAIAIFGAFFENVDRSGKNVVLRFEPRPPKEMLVACLYAHCPKTDKEDELWSFAAITNEPPPEVAAAGHDRCPINLKPENAETWLNPKGRSVVALQAILGDVERPYYEHQELAA